MAAERRANPGSDGSMLIVVERRQILLDRRSGAAKRDEAGGQAGCLASGHIRWRIADHQAPLPPDRPLLQKLFDHPAAGFAAIAGAAICRDDAVWVMRAIPESVDVGANSPKVLVHPAVQFDDGRLVVEAAGDAGLVSHDEHENSTIVEALDHGRYPVQPAKRIDRVCVACIYVERAVSIEEHCGTPQLVGEDLVGALQVGRDADVDEEAVINAADKQSLSSQLGENVLLEGTGPAGNGADDRSVEPIGAGVDQPGHGRRRLLAECRNRFAVQIDQAVTAGIGHPAKCDLSSRTAVAEGDVTAKIQIVDIKEGIAIQQEKPRSECLSRGGEGAGRAKRRAFNDNANARARLTRKGRLRTIQALHHGCTIAGKEHDIVEAKSPEVEEDVLDEGPSGYRQERLWAILDAISQPRSHTADQDNSLQGCFVSLMLGTVINKSALFSGSCPLCQGVNLQYGW
ncbi:hypothetical protein DF3PB_2060003 [uncultured Defluviicoccus sp.]|uniref:Uncharacterized protein n=1 Tax=metagenome TaxID=256318 RepID=A0A380TBD9_9ZZZZ|nr:hypothetical protein DF3PB_2060003 [uncultured Defluviicoccus sp.]